MSVLIEDISPYLYVEIIELLHPLMTTWVRFVDGISDKVEKHFFKEFILALAMLSLSKPSE